MLKKYADVAIGVGAAIILLVIYLIWLNSSRIPDYEKNAAANRKEVQSFFLFENITHYQSTLGDSVELIQNKDSLTVKDSLIVTAHLTPRPFSIADSSFLQQLENAGFIKHELDTSLNDSLNKIFSYKYARLPIVGACDPVFKDVLVFRKKTKIVGISSLCFKCNAFNIYESLHNTKFFGQNGDFEKLKAILKAK